MVDNTSKVNKRKASLIALENPLERTELTEEVKGIWALRSRLFRQ